MIAAVSTLLGKRLDVFTFLNFFCCLLMLCEVYELCMWYIYKHTFAVKYYNFTVINCAAVRAYTPAAAQRASLLSRVPKKALRVSS